MAATQAQPARSLPVGRQAMRSRSLWYDAWLRMKRNKVAVASLIVLALITFAAIFAPLLTPYSYDQTMRNPVTGRALKNQPPSSEHWFGTDSQARDVYTRVLYGARISLSVGLISEMIILFIGVPLGLLAGYFGRGLDMVLMRITDVMYAFPTILFAIVIVSALGQSLANIYLAIGLTFWPPMARLVRSQVLSLREKEFVESARSIGVNSRRIMFSHILPNSLGPIIVAATFGIPFAILIEAFLSFIGIGVPVPLPSWGAMIAEGNKQLRSEWWLIFFPGMALAITLFAFNYFGDGLRDALDPRSRK